MKKWFESAGPQNESVLSSCIRLSRNLSGLPFPDRLDTDARRRVAEKVSGILSAPNSAFAHRFRFIDLAALPQYEAVALAERGAVKADFLEDPKGRFLLLSADESKSIMINGEDHCLIQTRAAGLAPEQAYAAADQLDTVLEKPLAFAFDRKLGYLTCNPALLGTGMAVLLTLHLPALTDTGAAARIAANLRPLGITLRSAYGSAAQPKGAVFRLSNQMTLGISEKEALANLSGIAGQIIAQERAARSELIRDIAVQDTVGRSLGIFRSARLLDYEEYLNLASIVRFGIVSGFIKDVDLETADSLAVQVRPACLMMEAGHQLLPDEERALRAELVRDAFKK